MKQYKTPLLVAITTVCVAFALLMAWKTFFSPYIPAPQMENGRPEPTTANR